MWVSGTGVAYVDRCGPPGWTLASGDVTDNLTSEKSVDFERGFVATFGSVSVASVCPTFGEL